MKHITILILFLSLTLVFVLACGIQQPQAAFAPLSVTATATLFATQTPQKSTPAMRGCFGTVLAAKLNLRADADYRAQADGAGLVKGEQVKIVGVIGDWYKVKTNDGREGYAHSKYIHGCDYVP